MTPTLRPHLTLDRGGTFTDLVRPEPDGCLSLQKIRSDRAVIGDLVDGPVVLGTTVVTNAILEHNGVPTLLIVSRGFGDLPYIGDQSRPELFDPDAAWPAPLCSRVVEVGGRILADGTELEALPASDLARIAAWDWSGVEAVAVVLINSPQNAAHERQIASVLPTFLHVALGSELSVEAGLLARIETTLVDAAMTPRLRAALERDRVPPGSLALRSDASLCPTQALRAPDAVLSGPAGGVLAVAEVARRHGLKRVIGLDIGGTSTDVCRVDLDQPELARVGELRVAGLRVQRPALAVETIAAGGGSLLIDEGYRLLVGPRSAGAFPGPACYGNGGPLTLTDAALVAGRIDPSRFDPPLSTPDLPAPASLTTVQGRAEAWLSVAAETMAAAIRRIATARGVELGDHSLVAFGGAAGQHAVAVATRVGLRRVIVPAFASGLSAWGMRFARREEQQRLSLWLSLTPATGAGEASDPDRSALTRAWELLTAALDEGAGRALGDGAERHHAAELRYVGTDHTLRVLTTPAASSADLIGAFEEEHRRCFGFIRGLAVELVHLELRLRAPALSRSEPVSAPWTVDGAPLPGPGVKGPLRVDLPSTSVWVPEGWTARRRGDDLELLPDEPSDARSAAPDDAQAAHPGPAGPEADPSNPEHGGALGAGHASRHPPVPDPEGIALWGARFVCVAEAAGEVLRRLARSVNIRERLDFSMALFDPQGRLVANAPHVPVHLGAMGETVRDLLPWVPVHHPALAPSAWLTNDPGAGGSHLPDLTVITPVYCYGRRFFVASRAHHVDVGGLTPGSMPPHSRKLADEGLRFRRFPLLVDGVPQPLDDALSESRAPETVKADLYAQIAANQHAARELAALGPLTERWMSRLSEAAAHAVDRVIQDLQPRTATDFIDGVPLCLRLSVRPAEATGARPLLEVDFSGTGGPHPGNLNCPPGVVRAAVLYSLRVLAAQAIPLNEGALDAVKLVIPPGSILSPPPDAAVVGGNVETSQRLVDLFFAAAGARAASAGTMSNLTLGGEGWAFYETLGGGTGASPNGPGLSARQLHMTNTRATDVEVLERRLPLRVTQFRIRPHSGGEGHHRGGDGLVREIVLCVPGQAALLTTWRAAPGLRGGGPGRPGSAWLIGTGPEPTRQPRIYRQINSRFFRHGPAPARRWWGDAVRLPVGARVRIKTPGGGGWGPTPAGQAKTQR